MGKVEPSSNAAKPDSSTNRRGSRSLTAPPEGGAPPSAIDTEDRFKRDMQPCNLGTVNGKLTQHSVAYILSAYRMRESAHRLISRRHTRSDREQKHKQRVSIAERNLPSPPREPPLRQACSYTTPIWGPPLSYEGHLSAWTLIPLSFTGVFNDLAHTGQGPYAKHTEKRALVELAAGLRSSVEMG